MTTEKIDITLTKNIKTIRKLKSISQKELSEVLGVSHQHMHKYEAGKKHIPSVKVKMIADYFNMDINSFFTEDLYGIDVKIDNSVMDLVKNIKRTLLNKETLPDESLKIVLDEFFNNNRF